MIKSDPGPVSSDAGICAVRLDPLTYDVESAAPFHSTLEEEMKFDPLTVIEIIELPDVVDDGVTDVIVGTGFGELCAEIVKLIAPETCPPALDGFTTVTLIVPADANWLFVTCACSDVEETNSVACAAPLN